MAKNVSNKVQLQKLVELMQTNSDIGKGYCTKAHAKNRWEEFATQLNSLGPPSKSWEKWVKVWSDLKTKTKKKLMENKRELQATGGGPNRLQILTPIEAAIERLLDMNYIADPPGDEFGLVSEQDFQSKENEPVHYGVDVEALDEYTEYLNQQQPSTSKRNESGAKPKKDAKRKKIALLEKQIENQQRFYNKLSEQMDNIQSTLNEMHSLQERSHDLKLEKIRLLKEKEEERRVYRREKLRLLEKNKKTEVL